MLQGLIQRTTVLPFEVYILVEFIPINFFSSLIKATLGYPVKIAR